MPLRYHHIFVLLLTVSLQAAAFSTAAQQLKLPAFRMVLWDGKPFKAEQLPMGKPIVMIYFSPDCDHCEDLMKAIMKAPARFKDASLVMMTFLPVERVAAFVKKYKLQGYPNFYIGTEGTRFFVRDHYRILDMPFCALHAKDGRLVTSFSKVVDLVEIGKRLQQLK